MALAIMPTAYLRDILYEKEVNFVKEWNTVQCFSLLQLRLTYCVIWFKISKLVPQHPPNSPASPCKFVPCSLNYNFTNVQLLRNKLH